MNFLRHLLAILTFPFVVLIVIPTLILMVEKGFNTARMFHGPATIVYVIVGLIFIIFGLILLITTIRLFVEVGSGTLAPWDPPENLVVQGPYRFVRNPMISSVFFILLGECVLFTSSVIFTFAISFLLFNHLYFIFVEEKVLIRRFGKEYQCYKQNVPRWIPRISPWQLEKRDKD